MKIFITMSAYNEEKSIPPLFEAIIETFRNTDYSFQVILVDDGSSDNTFKVAESYGTKLPIKVIAHIKNKGLGEGIKTAIKQTLEIASDDDVMICLDADNTHHPQYIIPMVQKIAEGYDIIIASRFVKGSKQIGVSAFRRFISFGARILFQIFLNFKDIKDYTCGFRALKVQTVREAYKKFGDEIIIRKGFACTDELLLNLLTISNKVAEIPFILHYNKKESISKLKLWTTIKATLLMLISYRHTLKKMNRK